MSKGGGSSCKNGTVGILRWQWKAEDVGGKVVVEQMATLPGSLDIYSGIVDGRSVDSTGPIPTMAAVARLEVVVVLAVCCREAMFISSLAQDSIAALIQIKSGIVAAVTEKFHSGAGCDGGGDELCVSIAGISDCPCFIELDAVGGRRGGSSVADSGVDDIV